MFNNRNNDRKPDRGLIKKFQAKFSDVMIPTSESSVLNRPVNPKDLHSVTTNQATPNSRFTPFLDDQSLQNLTATKNFNKSPGISNPTSHGLAGDLHTPTLRSNLLTPETLLNHYVVAVTPLHRDQFNQPTDFFNTQTSAPVAQDLFSGNSTSQPSKFVQPGGVNNSSYGSNRALPSENLALGRNNLSQLGNDCSFSHHGKSSLGDHTNFRYHVLLSTPTAMIQSPNEAPITYLNKGQTYLLSITDSKPALVPSGVTEYRTSIRIAFDAKEQASNPNSCWSFWKTGSAHDWREQDRNLNAVELVNLGQDEYQTSNFRLERDFIDGFSIKWVTGASGIPTCTLGIRFNFLSTDFSFSKGVKGTPLRLCAKTETVAPDISELCYCKVKVFRDHGAERKMFTDVSQLKRAIERRKVEYFKAASGGDSLGKRKRGDPTMNDESNTSGDERTVQLQNDLNSDLMKMEMAFTSNKPVSVFSLPGDVKDDPDLYPIQLVGEGMQAPKSLPHPSLNSLTPSSTLQSAPTSQSRSPENQRTPKSAGETTTHKIPVAQASSTTGIKVASERKASVECSVPIKGEGADNKLGSGDKSTCFYIRFQDTGERPDDFHTALFLAERTLQDLKTKISQKRNLSQDLEVNIFHVKEDGLKIKVDDEVVQQIPNNQAMSAEISQPSASDDATEGEARSGIIEIKLHF